MRLSKYRTFILILLLIPTVLIPSIHPAWAVTYVPGVKPGDTWTFGLFQCQGAFCRSFVGNVSSVQFLVRSVSGSNVTTAEILHFTNGTSSNNFNGTSNVQTGMGVFFVVAGGLSAGDKLWNATGAPIINATITSTYAGAPRSVNLFESPLFTSSFFFALAWDKVSGILVDVRETIPGGFFAAKVTSTNIWGAATSAYFDVGTTLLPVLVTAGGSNTTGVDLRSINSFSGVVGLAVSISPAGPSAAFNPLSVTLSAASTGSSVLTVSAPSKLGIYFATVTGTSGKTVDSSLVLINVTRPNFVLTASPSILSFTVGSFGSANVTATSLAGFAGNLTLSAFSSPAGPSMTLAPTTLTLKANGTATSTLTVGAVATGTFNVTVLATSGSAVQNVIVSAVVTPSAALNASSLTLPPNGGTNSTSLKVSTMSLGPLTALALTSLDNNMPSTSTSGPTVAPSSPSSNLSLNATPSSLTVIQGSSTQSNITLKSPTPQHGPITLGVTVSDPNGVYVVTVTATNSTGFKTTASITVTVQDFVMAPTAPLTLPCSLGASCTTSITATAINGFTGKLALTTTASIGLAASLSPSSVSVPGSATLTVTAAAVGDYTVTVAGASGTLSHSTAIITVSVRSAPVFFGGKLSWTHHLLFSLNFESWTAKVTNPNARTIYVQVRIVGSSAGSGPEFVARSAVMPLSAGQSAEIQVLLPLSSSYVGLKFQFTAYIDYGSTQLLTTPLTSPSVKTGSFAVK